MGDLFKNEEKQKSDKPVFNITEARNADIEEEMERRKRNQEEQRKWMVNAPDQTEQRFKNFNKQKKQEKQEKILPSKEAAEAELKKDYVKITEPVLQWEEARYPDMPKEMHTLMREILSDDKRMTKSHFGKLKRAVEDLTKAESQEMKELRLNQLLLSCREYLDKSTSRTNKKRLERCKKLTVQIVEYKRSILKERELTEKRNAGKDIEAREIVRYLEAIETLKQDVIRPYPVKGDVKEKSAYNKEISGMGVLFSMQYNKLINACDIYLSKKNKPAVARSHYEDIREKAEAELKIFNNALTDFLSEHGTKKDITWGEALIRRTGTQYELDTKKSANVGAGTSNVYKIKRGTSDFDYFKEEEKLGKDIAECWDNTIKSFIEDSSLDNEQKEMLNDLNEAMKKDLNELNKDPSEREGKVRRMYDIFVRGSHKFKGFFVKIGSESNDKVMEYIKDSKYNILERLQNIGIMDEDNLPLAAKVMEAFVKSFNSYRIATNSAGIKAGSNLSSRNVATYRMAVALGIDECVARSETAKVKVNGREVFGNLMQEAKGMEAAKASKKKENAIYTASCVRDMTTMQVFDFICGQVDRNSRNYYVDISGITDIHSITMIDNDLCFGNLDPKKLEKGKMALPVFNTHIINTMSEGCKRRILEMDDKTMTLMLEDILTAEEIKMAYERLKYVKQKILEEQKKAKEKKDSADIEERLDHYCMQFEEYRSYVYQLTIYKEFNQAMEDFKAGKIEKEPIWHKTTYLNGLFMLSEEELEKEIKKYRNKYRKYVKDVQNKNKH